MSYVSLPRTTPFYSVFAEPILDHHGIPDTRYVFLPSNVQYTGPGKYVGYIVRATGQFVRHVPGQTLTFQSFRPNPEYYTIPPPDINMGRFGPE